MPSHSGHFTKGGWRPLLAVYSNAACFASTCLSFREPLGAVRVPAGSESFEALIYHCIKKAKKVAANNNNNSKAKKRTGQFCLIFSHKIIVRIHFRVTAASINSFAIFVASFKRGFL